MTEFEAGMPGAVRLSENDGVESWVPEEVWLSLYFCALFLQLTVMAAYHG
jgi:hypothetical protein